MNNFDQICNNVFNNVFTEAIINIPRNSLDPTIFQFPDNTSPIMQPEVKVQISNDIKTIDNVVAVMNCFVMGKILSPKYSHDKVTPIEVTVEVDPDQINGLNTEVLFNTLRRLNGRLATNSQHPINYYITQEVYDLTKIPAAYHVDSERWLKTPDVNKITESIIDYAHKTLDPKLWDIKKDPPKLLPELKNLIISKLKEYFGNKYNQYVHEIHITGSIGTQQWKSDTDIDVHVIPRDIDKHRARYEAVQSKVMNDFRREDIYVGKHPLEVFLQLDPAQETRGDASYDVINDKWIKMPFAMSKDFDPEVEFAYLEKDLSNIFKTMDSSLGELRRDLIDFDIIDDYVGKLDAGEKSWLSDKLQRKLNEIESDIATLVKHKDKYHQLRKGAYGPEDEANAWKDVVKSKSWAPSNVMWKMLDKYKYVSLILALQKVQREDDNDKIDPSDISKVKKAIGV